MARSLLKDIYIYIYNECREIWHVLFENDAPLLPIKSEKMRGGGVLPTPQGVWHKSTDLN